MCGIMFPFLPSPHTQKTIKPGSMPKDCPTPRTTVSRWWFWGGYGILCGRKDGSFCLMFGEDTNRAGRFCGCSDPSIEKYLNPFPFPLLFPPTNRGFFADVARELGRLGLSHVQCLHITRDPLPPPLPLQHPKYPPSE